MALVKGTVYTGETARQATCVQDAFGNELGMSVRTRVGLVWVLLNVLYSGHLQAMPAKLLADDGK